MQYVVSLPNQWPVPDHMNLSSVVIGTFEADSGKDACKALGIEISEEVIEGVAVTVTFYRRLPSGETVQLNLSRGDHIDSPDNMDKLIRERMDWYKKYRKDMWGMTNLIDSCRE